MNNTGKFELSQQYFLRNRQIFKRSQFLLKKKWVKMSFPDHSVNRKVVDNVEKYQRRPLLQTDLDRQAWIHRNQWRVQKVEFLIRVHKFFCEKVDP